MDNFGPFWTISDHFGTFQVVGIVGVIGVVGVVGIVVVVWVVGVVALLALLFLPTCLTRLGWLCFRETVKMVSLTCSSSSSS